MNHPIITIDANQDLVEASDKMNQHKIRRLIVTENGKIIGKITANSIARNLKYALGSSIVRNSSIHTRLQY